MGRDAVREVEQLRKELARLRCAIRRLDEGMNGPPGKRLSLETMAKRLEKLAERATWMQRRAETAEADWDAAEVTIARLTEQCLQDIAIWERRIDEAGAERDAFRRNATLAVRRENEALQQRVARLTEALENIVEHLHDEECARAGCKYYRQASAALAVVRGEG